MDVNFNNNKIIAACSGFATDIFLRLGLKPPTSIYAMRFSRIPGDGNKFGPNVLGFCFMDIPGNFSFDKAVNRMWGKKFNMRSVFLNSDVDWLHINNLMDCYHSENAFSTSHFLHPFIHEFCHNAHADYLYTNKGYSGLNSLGYKLGVGDKLLRKVRAANLQNYESTIIKEVSDYATDKPTELVAENMTELITKSLNPNTLRPQTNPFTFSAFVNGVTIDDIFKKAWKGIL